MKQQWIRYAIGGGAKNSLPGKPRVNLLLQSTLARFAARLSQQAGRLSLLQLQWLVALFLIAGTGACATVVWRSLQGKSQPAIAITPIDTPLLPSTDLPAASITQEEYERIQKFRIYIDSLSAQGGRQNAVDSFLSERPNLLDSIRWIEQWYQHQHKN